MPEQWERNEDESGTAYSAFSLYRDLGVTRSLDKAYQLDYAAKHEGQSGGKRASGRWEQWYKDNVWKERAEAYDQYRERLRWKAREAEHEKELEEYRARSKKLAVNVTEGSIGLLLLAQKKLAHLMKNGSEQELLDAIPVKSLPHFFRAAAACAEAGSNAEAIYLGVGELLLSLSNEGDKD